jgi:hypothetical protein
MKETLEEAAKKHINSENKYNRILSGHSFVEGGKWQAERMYGEEEVKQIIDATLIEYSDFVLADIPHWFEQFKKK